MTREFDPETQAAIDQSIDEVMQSNAWASYEGAQTDQLATLLVEKFQQPFVQLCCSGTLAVELAIRALKLKQGEEVLVAAYDFPGNFRACEAAGASIALADVSPNCWTFQDVHCLEKMRTPKTKAVIVSHLHGQLAACNRIRQWCDTHKIAMIEDVCQAPGASINGQPAGSIGDLAVLSFGGSKLLTAGRGGAVLTNNPQFAQRIKIFANRGNDAFALSQLQAAVLIPQVERLEQHVAENFLRVQAVAEKLLTYDGVQRTSFQPDSQSAFYKLAIAAQSIADRDRMVEDLKEHGWLAGAGFRGFYHRTSKRCRRVETYEHASVAAMTTVLLDHRSLRHVDASRFNSLNPSGHKK